MSAPAFEEFQVYALSETLGIEGGVRNESAVEATERGVLASERMTVSYSRSAEN